MAAGSLDLVGVRLQLAGECAGFTAEFGVIFVITVIAFHNQSAVCEVHVVRAIRGYVEACKQIHLIMLASQVMQSECVYK